MKPGARVEVRTATDRNVTYQRGTVVAVRETIDDLTQEVVARRYMVKTDAGGIIPNCDESSLCVIVAEYQQ